MRRSKLSVLAFLIMMGLIPLYAQTCTNCWHPNTKLLDSAANYRYSPDGAVSLDHDVKRFYQLLRDKQWEETYQLRAKAFRESVRESDYLSEAESDGKQWGLANYEILSVQFAQSHVSSTSPDEAILICKFTELPNCAVSYSTVFWHKEDGVWKCLSAGPTGLWIFEGMRTPSIDWR